MEIMEIFGAATIIITAGQPIRARLITTKIMAVTNLLHLSLEVSWSLIQLNTTALMH